GHHRPGRVEELRLQHADLRGRPAEHSARAVRGRAPGRGLGLGAVPSRDGALARAHAAVRHGDHAAVPLPAVLRTLRDDAGRPAAQHRHRGAADVRAGIPVVAHGARERDRVHPVRADAGGDVAADARAAGTHVTRRALGDLALNLALLALAVLTLAPLA